MASNLPLPRLGAGRLGAIDIVTDDALARETGVRVAFTARSGGVSEGPYASLNLAAHVRDDVEAVLENRRILASALGIGENRLVVPNQVHGTDLVFVDSGDDQAVLSAQARASSEEGADGVIVSVPDVAALLCFADCVPVIVVSPTGRFAVIHAGWRGVYASVAVRAVRAMAAEEASLFGGKAQAAASYNVYIGPHIHGECFETGSEVHGLFTSKFGQGCACDAEHISLARALRVDLAGAGVSERRVADAGICTVCNVDRFFSYRASGGVCGRHGAVAVRKG